jgi:sialic acid synthase SpsE
MVDTSDQNLYELIKNDPNRIYVIAEAGLSHGGNKERALALVRAAKWAGADAVKFQPPAVQEQPKKIDLPVETFRALQKEAKRIGIDFLSTASDEQSVDVLYDLGVSAFKIESRDITCRSLIEHVARKGKPVLVSTALGTSEQIEKAIGWLRSQSNEQAVLLHCASSYPAKLEELNLKSLQYLRERFGALVGFSDHSVGTLSSLVATSLGAQIIERHFMIESRADTPDHAVSMDAKTLKAHIEELRRIGTVLGVRGTLGSETDIRKRPAVDEGVTAGEIPLNLPRAGKARTASKARAAYAN